MIKSLSVDDNDANAGKPQHIGYQERMYFVSPASDRAGHYGNPTLEGLSDHCELDSEKVGSSLGDLFMNIYEHF